MTAADHQRLVSTLIHSSGDWISTWRCVDADGPDGLDGAWYGQAWIAAGVGNPIAYCPRSGPHASRRAAYAGALAEYKARMCNV